MRHRAGLAVLVLLSLVAPVAAQAQTATLRGFVRDAADGQALQGVNVALRGGAGLYGNATDRDGYFVINRIPAGTYTLEVSFLGYETYTETVTLAAGELATHTIELGEGDLGLGEVVVEVATEGAANMETAGLSTIRPTDLERIPTPGVSGDLVGYLQTMAGVVSAGDRGGQLFVRGGEPSQNLVLIDGIPLYQPFHVIGFYSAFPSEVINATDVYAGGFGARYGGRISSVIDVQSRTGNLRRFGGAVSGGPFLATAMLEGPVVPGWASFLVSVRESVIEPVAPQLLGRNLPYQFGDRFGRLNVNLSSRSSVSLTAMQTYDRGNLSGLEETDTGSVLLTDEDRVVWENEAYGIRFLHVPETYPVLTEVLFSLSRLDNAFGPAADPERQSAIQTINASATLTYLLGAQELDAGLFVRSVQLEYDLGGLFQGLDRGEEYLTEAGLFLDAAVPVSEKLIVRPGLRATSFRGRLTLEPRARVAFRPEGPEGRHQLSAAWGLYRQDLAGLNDRRDAGDVFTAWASSPPGTEVPQAMHAILGYGFQPAQGWEIGLEGYYKKLDYLLIPEWTSYPRFTTQLQNAEGRVFGADLRLEASLGPFFGYLSYGLSSVTYDAKQPSLAVWYGTDELRFHPAHDRRHQVNLLGQVELFDFDLSVRWQLGTGLPFSQSAGFDTWVMLDSLVDVTQEPGLARVLYAKPYNGRLPTYHRLDVSVERTLALGPHVTATLQGGLINAYDRANLFYLDIFTLRRINQLPFIPSFGLKLAFD